MCKCEIEKCAHAESKLLDGKIRCSVRGETVALKRCPDYVPFVVTNENIKNKFPEINHFIEKPKDYELLYYQDDRIHNEYPLEVSEAKRIFDYIDYLESKCKKQKEIIDKIYELIKQHIRKDGFLELNEWQTRDLLKLLKEVSDWTGERSKYKALLSMEKEEIVHRYFDLYSAYVQLSKKK